MANALFLMPAGGTASASSEQSGTPATNLTNSIPAKVWRSSSISGQYVRLDMGAGAATAATAAAFINANLSATATIAVHASNTSLADAASASALYSGAAFVGTAPASTRKNRIAFAQFANSTAYRYWHIAITDASQPLTYLEIGRLMIGTAWQPSFDATDFKLSFFSADPQEPSAANQIFSERRGNVGRKFDLTFAAVNRSEALGPAMDLALALGNGGDFLFSLDPADATQFPALTMQGLFDLGGQPTLANAPCLFDGERMYAFTASVIETV